jgi:hypothetical protein
VSENGSHDLPHFGYVVQPLQTKPEGLSAWFTITHTGKKASENGEHSDRFSQRWWLIFGDLFFGYESSQGFPFCLLKVYRAGDIRSFPAQFGEMMDPPGYDQIYSQACFQAIGAAQLSIFYPATAF